MHRDRSVARSLSSPGKMTAIVRRDQRQGGEQIRRAAVGQRVIRADQGGWLITEEVIR
jgi:hypothetical protein